MKLTATRTAIMAGMLACAALAGPFASGCSSDSESVNPVPVDASADTGKDGSTEAGAGDAKDDTAAADAKPDTGAADAQADTAPADAKPDTATEASTEAGPGGRDLSASLTWYGTNRDTLNKFLAATGKRSATYDAAHKPVAVFDWDNTVTKNDVGDATFYWMVKHDKVLQPAGKDWTKVSGFLTTDATAALNKACDTLADAGQPLPTSTSTVSSTACADELFSVYYNSATKGGAAAFAGHNPRRMEPAYAFGVQVFAGYSSTQARQFGESAIAENLAAAVGATQTVGSNTNVTGWIRVYDQIKDLIAALQDNGFDVWIVSASAQYIVEQAAQRVGVAADHVIGVRLVETAGLLTAGLSGCGGVADGTSDNTAMITYIDGKRCWINKVIYGDTSAAALQKTADPKKRQVFGAGDSDTDVTFLRDATTLKLVLNRNKKELMCNAYGNAGQRWLVNPMFIEPKAKFAAGFACSTAACKNETGYIPCVDEDGNAIPDQQDIVFGP